MGNYVFKNVNEALPALMSELLNQGLETGSRNGRTKEFLNNQITLVRPWEREILQPGRKASLAAQIVETVWVLSGRNDIKAISPYLSRAADFSDDGLTWRGGYGPRLRDYRPGSPVGSTLDQLSRVVDMLREDPLTRQAVIEIGDMTIDVQPGKDIPCTRSVQFLSRNGALYVTVNMRSNDAMWGWSGINAFEWSVVQEIVAAMLGLNQGTLVFNAGSFHLYEHHWDRARQIADNALYDFPRFSRIWFGSHKAPDIEALDMLLERWWEIEDAIRNKSTLATQWVDEFPEPMLRSWLRVLQYYWSNDEVYLEPIVGTALAVAAKNSVRRPSEAAGASGSPAPVVGVANPEAEAYGESQDFMEYVSNLHREKDAAYGDSWKRRGEHVAILANIARKVDRLGVTDRHETEMDTAVDLYVYLLKYCCWLYKMDDGPEGVDELIGQYNPELTTGRHDLIHSLKYDFEVLADMPLGPSEEKIRLAERMMLHARRLGWLLFNDQDEYRGADAD